MEEIQSLRALPPVSNTLIGWIGSVYETMTPAEFWAMHAAIAGGGPQRFSISLSAFLSATQLLKGSTSSCWSRVTCHLSLLFSVLLLKCQMFRCDPDALLLACQP
jgi:hypothetical protein